MFMQTWKGDFRLGVCIVLMPALISLVDSDDELVLEYWTLFCANNWQVLMDAVIEVVE